MDAHGSRTLKMNFQRDQSFPEFATARDRQIVRKLATRYVLAVRGTALLKIIQPRFVALPNRGGSPASDA